MKFGKTSGEKDLEKLVDPEIPGARAKEEDSKASAGVPPAIPPVLALLEARGAEIEEATVRERAAFDSAMDILASDDFQRAAEGHMKRVAKLAKALETDARARLEALDREMESLKKLRKSLTK